MADKNIGSLPQAENLNDDSLLVAEEQGQAVKVTGAQFKEFGRQAVIGQVQGYVDQAEAAADRAVDAVGAVTNMTVEATNLKTGADATVKKTIKDGKVNLTFGIPRGEKGEQGERGKTGPIGPKGAPGTGLKILGYYDTLEALEAAVPAPNAGDAYGVGIEAPYNIYVYDSVTNTWKDNGQLSAGGGGGVIPENVVTCEGGASVELPAEFGTAGHMISFVDEEEPPLSAEDIIYSDTQNVKQAIDGLKASVSDGKQLIASAITDKGVDTAQDATFEQMAENIGEISAGSDTSDATATSFDILSPKTAYTAAGKVEGVIPTLLGRTIIPSTSDQTIANGQYLGGTQVIKGDPNLTSSNIKKGMSIFGVAGALESTFTATLTVKADTGAVVTATHTDGTKVEALSTNGQVVMELPIEGTWKVTAVRGVAQYNTVTLQVSSQYNAELTAEVHIEYYGVGPALREKRDKIGSGSVGDYALFVGGYRSDNNSSSSLDTYDKNLVHSSSVNEFTTRSNLKCANAGKYAIFFGSSNGGKTFDESLTIGSVSDLSVNRWKLAATAIGGYALFGGGLNNSSYGLSTVDAYDENLTRTTITPLAIGSSDLDAASNGNYAIFAGGYAGDGECRTHVTAYDKNLTRTIATSLNMARMEPSAACAGNYVLFAGGKYFDNKKGYISVSTVDAYDLFLTHSISEEISSAKNAVASTQIQGYAIFGGGFHYDETSHYYFGAATVDCYDPYLTRLVLKELREARGYMGASTIGNFALFAGGFGNSAQNIYYDTVDVYQYV